MPSSVVQIGDQSGMAGGPSVGAGSAAGTGIGTTYGLAVGVRWVRMPALLKVRRKSVGRVEDAHDFGRVLGRVLGGGVAREAFDVVIGPFEKGIVGIEAGVLHAEEGGVDGVVFKAAAGGKFGAEKVGVFVAQ